MRAAREVALLLVLAAPGCLFRAEVGPRPFSVHYKFEVTEQEERALLEQLDSARAVYEFYVGPEPKVDTVRIWPGERLHSGAYAECRRAPSYTVIDIAAGNPSGGGVLVHELHHAAGARPDHKGPGWRRVDQLARLVGRGW